MSVQPAYRIDGRDASHEAFYATACDPRRNVVVEACAGAGKTWMLVSRILRALLDGAQPHEILAITFTRKAAGEMRTRLAEWLREFADAGQAQRIEALRVRGLDERSAHARADDLAQLHEQVLAGGRAVEVRTFHAWFSQLLRAAPLDLLAELGLQPGMALVEDLDDLRPELFRRFHAAVLADPSLHGTYRALVAARGRSTVRKWLEAAWSRRVEIELADAAGTLENSVDEAARHFPECAGLEHPHARARHPEMVLQCQALGRLLGALGKAKPTDAARSIEAALAAATDAEAFSGLWHSLFTEKGTPRKRLGDLPEQHALVDALQRLAGAVAQHEAFVAHGQMVRLSRVLLAEYAALKRLRALVDMSDLERVALALLADSSLSGWVQERLDARVRHLLIDEFQDTSPLQWHALHAWLAGYAGAGGGQAPPSVFIVGDPKQSIYRFRRAEPKVFAAARDFVQQALHGAVLECDHTRRNALPVINVVNFVFGELHAQGDYPGWRPHSTAIGYEVVGSVRRLPSVPRPARSRSASVGERVWRDSLTVPRHEPEAVLREAEAAQVAEAVLELVRHGGYQPGDIYVLSRKRASLRLAAQALQALHVPFAAPEESELKLLPEVRDLVAVLDVLASPGHDLSLAHALKSPLFDASDAELLALARAARGAGGWWAALHAGAAAGPALERARELLGRWARAALVLPPHDLLDRVVHEGDLHARLAAVVPAERRAAALEAVDSLLAQSLELDGGRYATPYNFVRALRQRALKSAPAARPGAVQLLTIHGAKGLEARAVFVMDAEPEAQKAETATLLVDWPVASAHPRRVAFVANENRCPPSLQPVLDEEKAARTREEFNGLYVAMTRAREHLAFSRTPPLNAGPARSWWQRIEALARPWVPDVVPAGRGAAAQPALIGVLPLLARAAVPPRAATEPEPVRSLESRLGEAVHRVLEWAPHLRPGTPREALARAAAALFGLSADLAAEVQRLAGRMLDSPACARFFSAPALRWAGNEVPLADGREVLRVDRLVQLHEGGQWWVLDYKLNRRPEQAAANREQLARYRRVVQALQPGEPVRAAFITADGELVEPDPPAAP
jgi:ATP-dependent helicase/nuclease subunit A